VPEPGTTQIREALKFSQFRFKLIEFWKLPFDIGEPALREVLERTSPGVYRNYLARAERVDEILKSEDTLEMSAPRLASYGSSSKRLAKQIGNIVGFLIRREKRNDHSMRGAPLAAQAILYPVTNGKNGSNAVPYSV
jgi:hypothetical protein